MKYLIVQDWRSTSGNHAGMVHMCNLLKDKYPNDYIVIKIPIVRNLLLRTIYKIFKIINHKMFWLIRLYIFCKPMIKNLKEGDEVFLLEYCFPLVSQYEIAEYLRKKRPYIKINALSHLTPSFFGSKDAYIEIVKKWSVPIDKMMTLGTSLSNFFIECGLEKSRISTGFHYVDNDFYKKKEPMTINERLRLIVMGNMQRNYRMLVDICNQTPNVEWVICCGGKAHIVDLFSSIPNVTTKGYLDEEELKNEMNKADISVNIMHDTIGSNVITTSLSMGLALVCSDVGSIRDYCNDKNTIFCENNVDSFVKAINYLSNNKEILLEMKKESIELSSKLSIENIHYWFCNL